MFSLILAQINRIPQRYTLPILLVVGLLLRVSAIQNWGFGFDQVQIFESASSIAHGDFTFIGPRTGPASLFTGPLIYYVTSIFVTLRFGYYSLVAVTLLSAVLTGYMLHLLVGKYVGAAYAVPTVFLWVFSVFCIRMDQVTWNPNLTLLASSLIFFPTVFVATDKKLQLRDLLLVSFGGFLSYQAHFSGFLLVPMALLAMLGKNKKDSLALLCSVVFGLIISLIPTLLFDYRNGWLNATGLVVLVHKIISGEISGDGFLLHLWRSFYTTFENAGGLVFSNLWMPTVQQFIWAVAALFWYIDTVLKKVEGSSKIISISLLWIFMGMLLLSLYPGDKPPYYFWLQLPALLVLVVEAWRSIVSQAVKKAVAVVFVVLAFSTQLQAMMTANPFSIRTSLRVTNYLQQQSSASTLRSVQLHINQAHAFGLQHMLKNIQTDQDGATDWYLGYPDSPVYAQATFSEIKLWKQPAPEVGMNDFVTADFRARLSAPFVLYRDNYYQGKGKEAYALFDAEKRVATIEMFEHKAFQQEFPLVGELQLFEKNVWHTIDSDSAFLSYSFYPSYFVMTSSVAPLNTLTAGTQIY